MRGAESAGRAGSRSGKPRRRRHLVPTLLLGAVVLLALPGRFGPIPTSLPPVFGTLARLDTSAPGVCNPSGPSPSSLDIPADEPTTNLSLGGQLAVDYQVAALQGANSTSVEVRVPTVFAYFPLANGTSVQVYIAPTTALLVGANWTGGARQQGASPARSNLSFDPAEPPFLTTEKIAVMAPVGYGGLTVEFRWQWVLREPGGPNVSSPWTTPGPSAAPPFLPSVFYPAPYVHSVANSTSPAAIGSNYTDEIEGAVDNTAFRVVLEYPNGTEIWSVWERSPPGDPLTFAATLPVLGPNHELAPGPYIFHVHDRCEAVVQIEFVRAVYAPSAQVTLGVVPASCGPIAWNGTPVALGASLNLTPSNRSWPIAVSANCPGDAFLGWNTTGGVEVQRDGPASTLATVSASGTLTALFAPVPLPTAFPTPIRHVFFVLLDNADLAQVRAAGPYEDHLAAEYASASEFVAVCRPALGDYLALVSGSTGPGCGGNQSPYAVDDLGAEVQRAGFSWAGFEESMPFPCDLAATPTYSPARNPFLDIANLRDNATECSSHDVSFTPWAADVRNGSLPAFALFTPDASHDGALGGVGAADAWLRGWLAPYLNASWANRTAWFILYDEGAHPSALPGLTGGQTYLTIASPWARTDFLGKGLISDDSVLSTAQWLLGLPAILSPAAEDEYPPLTSWFDFPAPTVSYPVTGTVASATTGAPLAQARIALSNSTAETGADGSFQFDEPNGTFVLVASAAGYASQTLGVTVNGAAVRLSLALAPATAASGTPLAVASEASTSSVVPGATVSFAASVWGGVPPYEVRWAFGDGTTANGSAVAHDFLRPGTYLTVATASDSDADGANTSIAITVEAPAPSAVTGGAGSSATALYGALGMLAGAVVGVYLPALRRHLHRDR